MTPVPSQVCHAGAVAQLVTRAGAHRGSAAEHESWVRRRWRSMPRSRRTGGAMLVVLGLPLLTAALVGARDDLDLGSLLLIYLLAVVLTAVVGGLVPGLLAAAVSFALANWFLAPPVHTLAVAERDSVVELVVFVVAAVVVAAVVELAAFDRVAYRGQLAAREEQADERAATDRAQAALLAAVGHDLRTPLAGAKVAVGSLRQTDVGWTPEQRDDLLRTVEEAVDRLTGLVTDILDVTRLRAGALTVSRSPVGLDEVVSRVLLRRPDAAVTADIPEGLAPVLADAGLLERVVDNLIDNATRYSPGRVQLVAEPRARRVRLHVVDHGPGVPAERRTEMFGAFQRLDDRSTGAHIGLGLAVAHGLAEAMGARITPETTPGGGLTMTLELEAA